MQTRNYIFSVTPASKKQGYNRVIVVYRLLNNVPLIIGQRDDINTASYKGDLATAHNIIAEKEYLDITDGYYLDDENIRVFEI